MTEPEAVDGPTPSQTVGPYLAIGLTWERGHRVVPAGTPGATTISGTLYDAAGEPVTDGMVETWQADPDGRFDHPDDPRGAVAPAVAGFRGFGRCATDAHGRYAIVTVPPGALGDGQAPHLDVSVFARGLLDRVVTRIYLPDRAEANAADPVLAALPPARAATLVARPDGPGALRFDIHLGGDAETVFFAL
jgi:protocatechuate 3,4-dioxygenase, alpha subunit